MLPALLETMDSNYDDVTELMIANQ